MVYIKSGESLSMRINKAIELLEQGQQVYGANVHELSYENGKKLSTTWADYLGIEMEHHNFDIPALSEFMKGLADSAPTPSGHGTPTVIVTLPIDGIDETSVRGNTWILKQVLATGIHGMLLCHAESPDAVRAFVESCRYPFHTEVPELGVGRRGLGGHISAAEIWKCSPHQYMELSDPWPLNPKGELFLGVKIENIRALNNCEDIACVPGLGFAEWGPGDMGLSLGYADAHDPPYPKQMDLARERIKSALDSQDIAFLCSWNDVSLTTEERVNYLLKSNTKILVGLGEDGARIGRMTTQRTMPV